MTRLIQPMKPKQMFSVGKREKEKRMTGKKKNDIRRDDFGMKTIDANDATMEIKAVFRGNSKKTEQ